MVMGLLLPGAAAQPAALLAGSTAATGILRAFKIAPELAANSTTIAAESPSTAIACRSATWSKCSDLREQSRARPNWKNWRHRPANWLQ